MTESKTIIPFPPYNYRIYVIFTDNLIASADKLASQGKLHSNHGIDECTDGFHVRLPNQSYSYLVLPYSAGINQIAHECYHSIVCMFDWISAQHEEELFAYHLGYLVEVVTHDQEKGKEKLKKAKNPLTKKKK